MKTFIDNVKKDFKTQFDKAISYGDMTDIALTALQEKMQEYITEQFKTLTTSDLLVIIPILRKRETAELIKFIYKALAKENCTGAEKLFMQLTEICADKVKLGQVTDDIEKTKTVIRKRLEQEAMQAEKAKLSKNLKKSIITK